MSKELAACVTDPWQVIKILVFLNKDSISAKDGLFIR